MVIAHPGDEAQLFIPSILSLAAYNQVTILCMSNGSKTGIGQVREKELQRSCEGLEIETPTVVNSEKLREGDQWKPEDVITELQLFTKT